MIVVDASIVAPMVLGDERPLPDDLMAELSVDRLVAPAHWPAETSNMLLVARRRQRLDANGWSAALNFIRGLGVAVEVAADWRDLKAAANLADREGLTLYDAVYLQLAIDSSAGLASLDGDLIKAALRNDVRILTYP